MATDLTFEQKLELRRSQEGLDPNTGQRLEPPSEPTGTPTTPQEMGIDVEIEDTTMAEIESAESDDNLVQAIGKGLVNGTIRAGESMATLLAGAMNLPIKGFEAAIGQEEPGFRFNAPEPTTFESERTATDVTSTLTQFGLQFYTGGNILKGFKVLQGAEKGTKFLNAMAKGAYADFTAFKGDEERLSDFLVTIDNSAVNNAVTQYLAGDPDDSDIEGRFKNMIEGAGLGVLADTLFYTARGINKGRKALMNGSKADAARFMQDARRNVGAIFEANKDVVSQIDEATLDAVQPAARMNVNRADQVLNSEQAQQITETMKSFKDWAGQDAYKYLDDKISGVVDKELFETTDDVAIAMDFMSDVTVPDFDVWTHEAREEMARTYGMTVNQLQQLKDLGAVNSNALLTSKAMLVDQAAVVAKTIDEGLSDDKVLLEMTRYKDLADIFLSFRNESGRVLDSNRIKMAIEEGDTQLINEFVAERFGDSESFASFKAAFRATGGDAAEATALMKMSKAQIAADSAIELWKNSILSGIKTFNVNLMGSMVNSSLQIPIRFFQGAVGSLRGGNEKVYMGEAAAMLASDVMSFMDLMHTTGRMARRPKSFLQNLKTPKALRDKAEIGMTRRISADYWGIGTEPGAIARFVQRMTMGTIEARSVQGAMRGAVDAVGTVVNLPGTALNIQDGFIQNHAMRKQKFALVYRKLMSEGVGPMDFGNKFYELLNDPEFNRQIAPELKKFAKRTTFQEEPGGIAQAFQRLQKMKVTPLKIPAFEFMLPFVRTPANILKQGITEPLVAPMTIDGFSKLMGKQGGIARDEMLGRMAFGWSTAAFVASMAVNGRITGAGPQDPDMRRQWKDAGNQPYSIRHQIGTDPNGNPIFRSYEYGRIEPLAFIIGSISSAIEAHHYTSLINDRSETTFGDYASAAITALNQATLDKSFFTGPQDFILFMSDPERYGQQWYNRMGTSFVPNVSRDIETMIQKHVYLRDLREFDNALNQKLIGGSRKAPVVRNRWGDPISRDKGWLLGHRSYFSPVGMDDGYAEDIDREINRLAVEGVNGRIFRDALIPMPDRAIIKGGVRIRLDAEQYSRLIEIAGKEIKFDNLGTGTPMTMRDNLNHLVNNSAIYKSASEYPATQARLIKQVSLNYDKAAREQLIREYPDLATKVKDAEYLNLQSTFGVMNEEMRMKAMELMGEEFE